MHINYVLCNFMHDLTQSDRVGAFWENIYLFEDWAQIFNLIAFCFLNLSCNPGSWYLIIRQLHICDHLLTTPSLSTGLELQPESKPIICSAQPHFIVLFISTSLSCTYYIPSITPQDIPPFSKGNLPLGKKKKPYMQQM